MVAVRNTVSLPVGPPPRSRCHREIMLNLSGKACIYHGITLGNQVSAPAFTGFSLEENNADLLVTGSTSSRLPEIPVAKSEARNKIRKLARTGEIK